MININSALIDLCSEGELAFVIGHELGHLKFNHHKLTAASADDNLSAILRSRLLEYNRMCEITADRAGFICSNLTDATQALFKLAIGTKSSLIKLKADLKNPNHVGSPLPGQIAQLFIDEGDKVIKGDKILIIEAMKMETLITADKTGTVKNLQISSGDNVDSKDLLFEIS